MAATSSAPANGFSYAQAAKSRPTPAVPAASAHIPDAQVPSSTVVSGKLAEAEPSKDWADEVDTSEKEKAFKNVESVSSQEKPAEAKSSVVERTKLDDKVSNSASGIPSPDMAASATSHDDTASAQNGSSQTSWEAKSQGSDTIVSSEPAWIAERKERQSNSHKQTDAVSGDDAVAPVLKPVVLQEAPPPTVNPWAKRAESAKSKPPAQPVVPPKTIQTSTPASNHAVTKENQRPNGTDTKHTANTAANATNVKSSSAQKPHDSTRPNPRYLDEKKPYQTRPSRAETQQAPFNAPAVQDSVSWPTPENSQDVERRALIADKAHEDKADDEHGAKQPRKKQEWKPVPVVPNIIWQTPGVRERAPRSVPNGERSARGGSSVRGRGGLRGGSNVTAGTERSSPTTKATEQLLAEAGSNSSGTVGRESSSAHSVRASSVNSRHGDAHSSGIPSTNGAGVADKSTPAAPNHSDSAINGTSICEPLPEQIPRSATSTSTNCALPNGTSRDSAHGNSEARKDSAKEHTWTAPTRGSRRGRGRGGNRDLANGHAYPHVNGVSAEHPYAHHGGPPSSMQIPRGNHQSTFPNYARGGPRSNGYRTQSLPLEHFYGYGRVGAPYMPHSSIMGSPAYPGLMADMYSYPISPAAFSPAPEQSSLVAVGHQIDYYFSVDNLLKDMYLRKNMDSQGFVLLDTVAAFKRVSEMTQDRELLKSACQFSEIIEIRMGDDGKERLRKASDWVRWVLPTEERLESARHEGPQSHEPLNRFPGSFTFQPSHLPSRTPIPNSFAGMPYGFADRRSYEYSGTSFGGTSPQAMFMPEHAAMPYGKEFVNGGDDTRDRHQKSPARESSHEVLTPLSPGKGGFEQDADLFPNEQIEQLTVCVKVSKNGLPQHASATRTFSNGSIDTSLVHSAAENDAGSLDKSTSPTEPDAATEDSNTKNADANGTVDSDGNSSTRDVSVFWIKDNDKPVGTLPSDLTPEPYVQLRHKALDQRSRAASGKCPYDLDVLYQFWSHFLIRNFNYSMYSDFKHLAGEDAAERDSIIGRRNLAKYYNQALNSSNQMPLRVAKDYVTFIKTEVQNANDNSPAFKALHRAWRDGALNLRNRKRLSDLLDNELRVRLEN